MKHVRSAAAMFLCLAVAACGAGATNDDASVTDVSAPAAVVPTTGAPDPATTEQATVATDPPEPSGEVEQAPVAETAPPAPAAPRRPHPSTPSGRPTNRCRGSTGSRR